MSSLRHITMIVKPFKSQAIIEFLETQNISHIHVYECQGYGRQKGHLELYSGPEYSISFIPKIAIEFLVSRFEVEELLNQVIPIARTGRIGDGKVFITDVIDTSEMIATLDDQA